MKDILEKEILKDVDHFVANINDGLKELDVKRSDLTEMDHICYRVETQERYDALKQQLARTATLLGESMVGDPARPISTFQFREPLDVQGWRISYLELPAPKEGSPYSEGLEHAEMVVLGGDLDQFQKKYVHLDDLFSQKGMNKPLNPELGLKVPDLNLSVKFHRLPLGEVVRLEKLTGQL